MNKLTVLATVMAAGLFAGNVNATQIQINADGIIGSSFGPTDFFDSLTLGRFSPSSIYTPGDTSSPGGTSLASGDIVRDVGKTSVSSLNFIPDTGNFGGFRTAGGWSLNVSWNLVGQAVLPAPGIFLGQFNGGNVSFDMCNFGTTSCTNVLNLNIVSSGLGTVGTNSIGINITGVVSTAQSGVFFDEFGRDFADTLGTTELIFGLATSDILNINNVPTAAGCAGVVAASAGDLCRTTTLTSVDVGFSVPEPASLAILGLGLMGMGFSARRKNKATA